MAPDPGQGLGGDDRRTAAGEAVARLPERLIAYFRIASGLLTIEVVAWIVDLATKT